MFELSACLSVCSYSTVQFSLAIVGMTSSVLHIQENTRHFYDRIERPLLLISVPFGVRSVHVWRDHMLHVFGVGECAQGRGM